jgi:nucleotide-binding universal stress UspA family protein
MNPLELTETREQGRQPVPNFPTHSEPTIAILAAVSGAPDDEDAVAIAADFAHRNRSPVTVVNTFEFRPATIVPPAITSGVAAAEVWRSLDQERVAVGRRIRDLVDEYSHRLGGAEDSSADDAIKLALPSVDARATLMRELPLADLVILAQSSVKGDGPWVGPLAEALMTARAPVYLARNGHSAAGRPAAIAWDGGFEAARAVRAALPLLRDAAEITILQAPDGLEASRADPERLEAWLAVHGVSAQTVVQVRAGKVGEALLEATRSLDAALLVAGAYRHSRIGEALLGGATRAFMEAGDGPHLLVAH